MKFFLLALAFVGSIELCFSQNNSTQTPLLPNIITPNGDGKNDRFEIGEYDFENAPALTVVNRYGKTVFEANRYINQWDASDLEAGQYFYVLRFSGELQGEYSGVVTVVKQI